MLVLLKLSLVICVVGILRCCEWFRSMSRETDDAALAALNRIKRAAEEYGDHPEIISLLMLLTGLLMLSLYVVTQAAGR
jgi:hypothetical protein